LTSRGERRTSAGRRFNAGDEAMRSLVMARVAGGGTSPDLLPLQCADGGVSTTCRQSSDGGAECQAREATRAP
jgi:hypothetical protein